MLQLVYLVLNTYNNLIYLYLFVFLFIFCFASSEFKLDILLQLYNNLTMGQTTTEKVFSN